MANMNGKHVEYNRNVWIYQPGQRCNFSGMVRADLKQSELGRRRHASQGQGYAQMIIKATL